MAMFTISLWGCVTDRKCSIPKGFECFNSKRVFIQYKQPVNGYTVKVMWLPYLNSKYVFITIEQPKLIRNIRV